MVIGSVLARFRKLELSTADEKHYTLNNSPATRLAWRLIGVPHLGFRGRARVIIKWASQAPRTARILDAGCGYGIYSLTLASHGYNNINSIDLDPKRIGALQEMSVDQPAMLSGINLQIGSVTNLPFLNQTFDLVICSEVIEHVKDDIKAVRELARVIRPGGKLLLSVPYNSDYNKKIFRKFGHERPGYTKEELAKLFKPLSLEIKKDAYYEYSVGTILFELFNRLTSKPLMGLFFYPFYTLYRLDSWLKIGEPNGIVVELEKKS